MPVNATDVATWRHLPLAVAVAGFGVAYAAAPTQSGNVTCLLRVHAGHACPGCGMTRALGRLVHGDVVGAAAYHPWIFALVLQVVAVVGWRLWWAERAITDRHVRAGAWLVSFNAVSLAVVWVVRIVTGHLAGVY